MRAVVDTAHECLELWADPPAWQNHLMRRVTRLAGCRIGIYFEMADHTGMTADRVLAADDTGWESAGERRTVIEGLSQHPLRYSPLWAAFANRLALRATPRRPLIARQDSVIARSDWQRSEMFDRHVRPTRLGNVMLSAVWMNHLNAWSVWSLVTERSDPAQSQKHRRLAQLLHLRVAPMIGTRLSTWRDRNLAQLSATRRVVLELLLAGDSEPGIAERTFRSRSAVHEHVTAIYRHFGVRSRGEFAAVFLHRHPVLIGAAARQPSLNDWLERLWAA